MHRISHKDFAWLLNMYDCIEKIQNYTNPFNDADEFYEDTISFDATLMNFIIIGEMVEKLSDLFLIDTSKYINWKKVKGFRNIIAYNYFGIDAEEVWQIIQSRIPKLKSDIAYLMGR
jgi:uncharacterized protein with HEPN domain